MIHWNEPAPSRWADGYIAANPEKVASRRESSLEPGLAPSSERYREESAHVEKYLWGPTSPKVDTQGPIYIVDRCRHRIQVCARPACAIAFDFRSRTRFPRQEGPFRPATTTPAIPSYLPILLGQPY